MATFAPDNLRARIDSDGNSMYDALTDGLLMIRYLFGLTGDEMTNAAIGDGATRLTAEQLSEHMDNVRPLLDVDGNGRVDAHTDGLLLLRYLFGLRGASLVSNAVGPGASRMTFGRIESYIQTIMS